MRSLENEAELCGVELAIFAERHRLPRDLFLAPDNIVIKAADINAFGHLIREEIVPISRDTLCVETDPRLKVAAELTGSLALHNLGYVDWVEVDEPELSQEYSSSERVEFYYDDLEKALTILRAREIDASITPEKSRSFIGLQGPSGREFRLTDTPLWEIVEAGLESDEVIRIY